ncbi:MAG: MFS transporter, partial [Acidobacteria bacterium]|nr:MFS transporter [Acidobacteriota bacterium]
MVGKSRRDARHAARFISVRSALCGAARASARESHPTKIESTGRVKSMNNKRWWVVCWLSLGMVIAYIDRVNLTSAMPSIGKMMSLDDEQRGMALSAFFWTYTIGQIPAGVLVDRYGVRLLYTLGITLWSIASACTVLTTGLWALVATRLFVGLGESVVTSSSLRYIRAHFAEKERGFAVGVYMTGTKIGPAIGLPLAGFLVVQLGWQAMFLIMGLGSLLWLGPWLGWVKKDDPAALPAGTGAGAEKTSIRTALRSSVMWGIIIGTYCYMYFVYYCMTWMPQYFQKTHELSIEKSNWFSGVSFGGMAAVAAIAGWVADRWIARGGEPVFVR